MDMICQISMIMGEIMSSFVGLLYGVIIGFAIGIVTMVEMTIYKSDIAVKLANVMNASMLDCVTKKIITNEQVNEIEIIFNKHIEANFKGIKAKTESK